MKSIKEALKDARSDAEKLQIIEKYACAGHITPAQAMAYRRHVVSPVDREQVIAAGRKGARKRWRKVDEKNKEE